MKRMNKFIVALMAFSMMGSTVPMTSFAADTISRVYVDLGPGEDDFHTGETRQGMEPVVDENRGYTLDTYSVSKDSTPRSAYTYTIELESENGYKFSDKTDVEVYGGVSVSVSSRSSNKMKLKVKTYPYHVLANVKNIKINNNNLTWDKVDYAKKYSVVIHYTNNSGDEKTAKKNTTKNSLDIKSYVKNYTDVYASVQAVKGNNESDRFISNSEYVKADGTEDSDFETDTYKFSIPTATLNGIKNNENNSNPSNSNNNGPATSRDNSNQIKNFYLKNEGWNSENGEWHYIKDGKVITGWLGINSKDWFYFGQNGVMKAGWVNDNGKWYLCNTNHDGTYGMILSGWQKVNGVWYYMHTQHDGHFGELYVNTTTPDGYRVDSNGAWIH